MTKLTYISKYLLTVLIALVVTIGGAGETLGYQQADTQQEVNENADQDTDGQEYIQALDIVSQNLQVNISIPVLPTFEEIEAFFNPELFFEASFPIASTRFFKVLFRQIISPNAP